MDEKEELEMLMRELDEIRAKVAGGRRHRLDLLNNYIITFFRASRQSKEWHRAVRNKDGHGASVILHAASSIASISSSVHARMSTSFEFWIVSDGF